MTDKFTDINSAIDFVLKLKEQINVLETSKKEAEEFIKKTLIESNETQHTSEHGTATISHHEDTVIADTSKMKKDGIFEKYSKVKKGYDALFVRPIAKEKED